MDHKEPIPRGIEYLHEKYLRHEKIEWKGVNPGTEIVIEAYDRNTGDDNFLNLTVLEVHEYTNGIPIATMAVGETEMWVTEDTPERDIIHLPTGTILQSGVSATYFPIDNITMAYFGGISINRDYSFNNVVLPDGRVLDGVLIPQVKSVMSFLPSDDFDPVNLDGYNSAVQAHKEERENSREEAEQQLDQVISERTTELFGEGNEETRREIIEQFATFNPEGRYTLLCLMEHSNDQGVLEKFNDVLKAAVQKEFMSLHPIMRGSDMFPQTQRGWRMMINELGLSFDS